MGAAVRALAGEVFPPLDVFHDGTVYWLADGFHRHYAAQNAGKRFIRCNVHVGGLREAILHSVGANAKHGLARSDNDKRRAVERLLADEEWAIWSDRDIAKRCHVSHTFVARVRADTGHVASMDRTFVHPKTGQPTTMRTGGINAERRKPATSEPVQAKISEPAAKSGHQEINDETTFEGAIVVGIPAASPAIVPAFDRLVALWCEAPVEDRDAFLSYLRVNNQIGGVPHADRAGAVVPPQSAAPARPPKPLRPHCQKPDACGGYGAQHCRSCLRAVENA
jgi:hypothetical protein